MMSLIGVCLGVSGSAVLMSLVAWGKSSLPGALFAGAVFSVPYVLIILAALGYSDSRFVLWSLLMGAATLGGVGSFLRLMILQTILGNHAAFQAAAAAGKRLMNCGPPPELFAIALMPAESVLSIFYICAVLGAYLVHSQN
jgi:hypothetical protein